MNETATANEPVIMMLTPGQIRISEVKLRDVDREDPKYLSIVESISERVEQGQRNLIMPITVTPDRDPETGAEVYTIVDGLQRFNACIETQQEQIPCIVDDLNNSQILEQQFQGNFSRVPQRPAQAGLHLTRLMAEHPGMTSADLAKRVAQPKSQIDKYLSLTKLTDECKAAVDSGDITVTAAVLLAKLPTENQDAFLDSAQNKSADDLKAETTAFLREHRKAKREAREATGPVFEPRVKLRSKKALIEVFEDQQDTLANQLLGSRELTTPLQGFNLAIAYMLHANDEAVAEQRAKFDEEQEAKAEKARLKEEADKAKLAPAS